jgi:ankyrin repeat protein
MEPLMKKFKPSPQLKPLPQEIWYVIASFCNIKALYTLMNTSIVKSVNYKKLSDTCHERLRAYRLRKKYEKEFPKGTPLVCACEKGRFEDVKLLITGYNDVNESGISLKEYVNQEGKVSRGYECTPLMAAAWNEHFQLVKYLIEQGEADPNIANSVGMNALHYAAVYNRTNTELIQLLLTHMSLDSINKKDRWGQTPLDCAYAHNDSSIQQEIIALLRSKGGKANCHDENGRHVGEGNGDLNE